jgi:acyl carrier protein
MNDDEILQALTEIMREYFDDDGLVLTRSTTAEDIPAWDSLNHVNIIVAVEQRFRIHFLTAEVEGLHNVGALIDLIKRKLER